MAVFLSHCMWNLPLPLIKGLYQRGSKDISSGSGLEWVETNGLLPSPFFFFFSIQPCFCYILLPLFARWWQTG